MAWQSSNFSEGDPEMGGVKFPDFLDGVNIREGLANMDGSQSLYLRILVNVLRRCRQFMDQLDGAMDRGDHGEVKRMFHTIKGLAGSIGAEDLRKSAEAVEHTFAEGVVEVSDALMLNFKKELGRVANSLSVLDGEPVLDREASDHSGGELGGGMKDDAHLNASFKVLELAIEEGDGDVMEKLSVFGNSLGKWRHNRLFQDLVQQVDDYDFDQAGATLQRLWSMVHGLT